MKSHSKNWADPVIALIIMLNVLLIMHLLNYGSVAEQSAQILAILLFYSWLANWVKRA
jgi:hypothetical protein